MYQPYIDILVDGVLQRREAYHEYETVDLTTTTSAATEFRNPRLRPRLNDNEVLCETLDGRMEIVTYPKP